jgi:L-threonylcarbamoyladenylate synthase
MKTLILNQREVRKAASLIKAGELVVFPTETVYGLGADAFNPDAVEKIFLAKGRPANNPLIVHLSEMNQIQEVAEIQKFKKEMIQSLLLNFWPGPLTIILPKHARLPKQVTAGLDTVAVRLPAHNFARKLVSLSGSPIAAPSANISGRASGTCFKDVLEDLDGRVAAIVKSTSCKIGIESTVIDLSSRKPTLLRPGGATLEELSVFLPDLVVGGKKNQNIRSPGMMYRHYSPRAQVILFERGSQESMEKQALYLEKQGKKVKIIYPDKIENFSSKLFHILRDCDRAGFQYILISSVQEKGIGLATMDRLRRAASKIFS